MKIWTIQHQEALDELDAKGVFRAEGRRCSQEYPEAYRWMQEKLVAHRPGTSYRPLVWGWASKHSADLRRVGHLPHGVQGVRFELEVPEDRVLLSDFEAWHWVLNQEYVPKDAEDHQGFEEEWDSWRKNSKHAERLSSFRREHRDRILESQERIFNIEMMANFLGGDDPRDIQGVFTHFTKTEVVRVTRFTAR